jgi:hypothetical protein
MNNDDTSGGCQEPQAIRIDYGYDVDFLTRILGVSEGELKEMVHEYGDMDLVIRSMIARSV